MPIFPWFIIPLVVAVITLAVISLKKIREWINKNKTGIGNEKVELIKERLKNGDCKVVVGVFKQKIYKKYSGKTIFEGKKIDDDLESRFGKKKKIVKNVDSF